MCVCIYVQVTGYSSKKRRESSKIWLNNTSSVKASLSFPG